MNCLKARKRYDAEREAERYRQQLALEEEMFKRLSEEEQQKYIAEKQKKLEEMRNLLALPLYSAMFSKYY